MKLAKTDLLDALRLRYDHYSAQSVFEMTLAHAKLPDQAQYDDAQIATFRTTLKRVGDRVEKVDARIDALLAAAGPAPAAAATPAPAATTTAAPAAATTPTPPAITTSTPAATPGSIETTITLAGVEPCEGEQVLVCGGVSALGDWDPEKAATMKRDGGEWRTTIAVPSDVEAQFKFLRRTADGTVIWEDGANRELVARPRIDATWR